MGPDIIFLLIFNILIVSHWYRVCFKGGDKRWHEGIKKFWGKFAYQEFKPIHLKIFMYLFLIFLIIGDIGVLINKLQLWK